MVAVEPLDEPIATAPPAVAEIEPLAVETTVIFGDVPELIVQVPPELSVIGPESEETTAPAPTLKLPPAISFKLPAPVVTLTWDAVLVVIPPAPAVLSSKAPPAVVI